MPTIYDPTPCPVCEGTGDDSDLDPQIGYGPAACSACFGTGRAGPRSHSDLDIEIRDQQHDAVPF